MSAIRKLAVEAMDNGLLAPELAAGIGRVKSAKTLGVRTGNWLNTKQAQALLNAPDISKLIGLRDRANRSTRQYTGTPCSGNVCPGWIKIDSNRNTSLIFAGPTTVYQQHQSDNTIWQYTGTPCNLYGCPGWQLVDNDPNTLYIVAGGTNFAG
jgi:hypothetical protein